MAENKKIQIRYIYCYCFSKQKQKHSRDSVQVKNGKSLQIKNNKKNNPLSHFKKSYW